MRFRRQRSEWIGGRVRMPVLVAEPTPHYPDVIVWVSMPDCQVAAATAVYPPEPETSLGEVMLEAMRRPMEGLPRRPDRVRVCDVTLADEVRAVAPDIEVVVAPTPEIEALVEVIEEAMPRAQEPSYLDGLTVSDAVAERFFKAARLLYLTAPWDKGGVGRLLRIDIPELDVVGGCMTLMGGPESVPTLNFFPAFEDFRESATAFLAMLDDDADPGRRSSLVVAPGSDDDLEPPPPDQPAEGGRMLTVAFVEADELPRLMRREVEEHGWPVAAPEAYPLLLDCYPPGERRSEGERKLRVLTSCCTAMAAFTAEHAHLLGLELHDPVSASYLDDDGIEARLTMPYGDWPLHEAGEARAAARRAGANDLANGVAPVFAPQGPIVGPEPEPRSRPAYRAPCRCGSAKQYLRCCLEEDLAAGRHAGGRLSDDTEDLDPRELLNRINGWGYRVAGDPFAWEERRQRVLDEHLGGLFDDFDAGVDDLGGALGEDLGDLLLAWVEEDLLTRADGDEGSPSSMVGAYCERHRWRLDGSTIAYLEALDESTPGLYEVGAAGADGRLRMVDMIGGGDPVEVVAPDLPLAAGTQLAGRILAFDDHNQLSDALLPFPPGAAQEAIMLTERLIEMTVTGVRVAPEAAEASDELIERIVRQQAMVDAAPVLSTVWVACVVLALGASDSK